MRTESTKIAAQYTLGGSTYEGTMPDGEHAGKPLYVKEIIIPPRERIGATNYDKEVRRIQEQVAIGRKLDHPHHITLLDYVVEGDTHYLYYPIAPGKRLQDIVAERNLDTSEILCILEQVAAAYAYAHERDPPIIHADTSPANIMYDPETKHATVIDHGASLARVLEDESLKLTTRVLITNGYAAPEVLSGDITPKADIYGLGMLLSFMMTGEDQKDFIGYTGMLNREKLEKRLEECAKEYAENPGLVSLWKKMTAENPADRPTAPAVLESLVQIREGRYEVGTSLSEYNKADIILSSSIGLTVGILATYILSLDFTGNGSLPLAISGGLAVFSAMTYITKKIFSSSPYNLQPTNNNLLPAPTPESEKQSSNAQTSAHQTPLLIDYNRSDSEGSKRDIYFSILKSEPNNTLDILIKHDNSLGKFCVTETSPPQSQYTNSSLPQSEYTGISLDQGKKKSGESVYLENIMKIK